MLLLLLLLLLLQIESSIHVLLRCESRLLFEEMRRQQGLLIRIHVESVVYMLHMLMVQRLMMKQSRRLIVRQIAQKAIRHFV